MFSKVPYDVKRDFAFITEIASKASSTPSPKDVAGQEHEGVHCLGERSKGKVSYGSTAWGRPATL